MRVPCRFGCYSREVWRRHRYVPPRYKPGHWMLKSGIRSGAPFDAILLCATSSMERASRRDKKAVLWEKEGRVLTPFAKALWDEQRARAGEYFVRRSTASIFFVCRQGYPSHRRIDTSQPSCSCATYDQQRIACRHIVAVLQHCGTQSDAINAFDKCYLAGTYVRAFKGKGIELPLHESFKIDSTILPSPYYKQGGGRRNTRRIASAGESGSKSTYVCRNCSQHGHNKRTCRRHIGQAEEANDELVASPVAFPPIEIPPVRHTLSFLLN